MPKGSMMLSEASYRFGPHKCGDRIICPSKEENCPPACGGGFIWCGVTPELSYPVLIDLTIEVHIQNYYWVSFHTYCKKKLFHHKIQKMLEQVSLV